VDERVIFKLIPEKQTLSIMSKSSILVLYGILDSQSGGYEEFYLLAYNAV
jgi:hypothetical protein